MTSPPKLRLQPRDWQAEALDLWESNNRLGVVAVVTGGGKTAFAELCLERVWQTSPGHRVAIVVPTSALLDQWHVSLEEDMGLGARDIATYSGDGKSSSPGLVNLFVINTARSEVAKLCSAGPMGLVVDECHRAASPENARALEGRHAFALGLSATPERDYDNKFMEVVAPKLGPIIYRYGYNEARRDGVIVPFDLQNISVPLTAQEEVEYERHSSRVRRLSGMARNGANVEDQLIRALQRRSSFAAGVKMRVPVALRLLDDHRGEKVIVFHEKIAAVEAIAHGLRQRGHRATTYHSKIGGPLRRDNLRMFRRGEVDVLVTCRALDEGINVPDASVGIIASSTASTRQRIQRLGRLLRPAPGKSASTICTLFATDCEKRRLAEEANRLTDITNVTWHESTARL